jgi:hypothetical protein
MGAPTLFDALVDLYQAVPLPDETQPELRAAKLQALVVLIQHAWDMGLGPSPSGGFQGRMRDWWEPPPGM